MNRSALWIRRPGILNPSDFGPYIRGLREFQRLKEGERTAEMGDGAIIVPSTQRKFCHAPKRMCFTLPVV